MEKKPIDVFEDAAIAAQLGGKARKAGVAAALRQAKRAARDPKALQEDLQKRIRANLSALVCGGAVFHIYAVENVVATAYLQSKSVSLLRVCSREFFCHDPGLKPCNPAAVATGELFTTGEGGRRKRHPGLSIAIATLFATQASWIPAALAHRARLDLLGRERFIEAEWAKIASKIAQFDANYRRLNGKTQPEMTLAQSLALHPDGPLARMSAVDLEIFDAARARAITPSHQKASERAALSNKIEAAVALNVAELEQAGLLSHVHLRVSRSGDNPRQRSVEINSSWGIGQDGSRFDTGEEKRLAVSVPLFSTSLIPSFSGLVLRARLARLGPEKLVEDSWARAAKSIAEAGESLRAASAAPVPARLAAVIEARELSTTVAKPLDSPAPPRRSL